MRALEMDATHLGTVQFCFVEIRLSSRAFAAAAVKDQESHYRTVEHTPWARIRFLQLFDQRRHTVLVVDRQLGQVMLFIQIDFWTVRGVTQLCNHLVIGSDCLRKPDSDCDQCQKREDYTPKTWRRFDAHDSCKARAHRSQRRHVQSSIFVRSICNSVAR